MKDDKQLLKDLKNEFSDLSTKIGILINFIGFCYLDLDSEDLKLLEDQLHVMIGYRSILKRRIDKLKTRYNL